ncbi:unnamed protein product [Prorocentrum cordatum]|uniref:Inward rectifier potassium channel C-terminal domain-containing protein n=1 Tax=Prorocentrum cordatum TaxID=2364126 RepID=A0ABN9Q0Y4_9DINO|nr:unnamed protein product [Polarella glacialis]
MPVATAGAREAVEVGQDRLDEAHEGQFVCDARKHQLARATVSCYALLWRDGGDLAECQFEQRPMRLVHPDDELGGTLLLTFPARVVHEIDAWSPLAPPRGDVAPGVPQLMRRAADRDDPPPGPARADVEAFLQSNRVEVIALVEGEEPITSCTTQARHSYVNEDLAFDCTFANAVVHENGTWAIQYEKLQELLPAPPC